MNGKRKTRVLNRLNKHRRIRKKLEGTPERPRVSVYRSLKHIYSQIIDDESGRTIVASSTLAPDLKSKISKAANKMEKSKIVGEELARKAVDMGIRDVVFDRSGYIYRGRIRVFAEALRSGGLKF